MYNDDRRYDDRRYGDRRYDDRRYDDRRSSRKQQYEEDPDMCIGKNCAVATTGALQVLVGVVSIVFGIIVLSEEYDTDKSPVAMPVWAGAWYVLTGIVGLLALCINSRMLMIVYVIMSLLSGFLAATQVIWESIASTIHKDEYLECDYPFDGSSFDCFKRLAEYMHIAAAVTGGVEIIVATCAWALAICRGGCDCCMQEERVIMVSRSQQPARSEHRHEPSSYRDGPVYTSRNSNTVFVP